MVLSHNYEFSLLKETPIIINLKETFLYELSEHDFKYWNRPIPYT